MTGLRHTTPGPWAIHPGDDGNVIWIGNEGENAACVPGYADHPGNIANAYLVAAAPDLLEAALEVIARWETPLWKDTDATAVFINRLRHAVKKASGEF